MAGEKRPQSVKVEKEKGLTKRKISKRKMSACIRRDKQGRWDPATIAAELALENRKVRQGRRREMGRGWMKEKNRMTDTEVKCWRPGTKAIHEIRFYQRSTVLLIPMQVFCRLVKEIGHGIRSDLHW